MSSSTLSITLNQLAREIHENAVEKGFWESRLVIRDATALVDDIQSRQWEPKVLDAIPEIVDIIESHMEAEGRNDGECIALMTSELSEALEALRKNNPPDHHCPEHDNATVELADCIIRILDFAGARNLPLGEALVAKKEYNRKRPHKHGKTF